MQHHKWALSETENLYVFERDLYTDMLKQYLKEEQERLQQQNRK